MNDKYYFTKHGLMVLAGDLFGMNNTQKFDNIINILLEHCLDFQHKVDYIFTLHPNSYGLIANDLHTTGITTAFVRTKIATRALMMEKVKDV